MVNPSRSSARKQRRDKTPLLASASDGSSLVTPAADGAGRAASATRSGSKTRGGGIRRLFNRSPTRFRSPKKDVDIRHVRVKSTTSKDSSKLAAAAAAGPKTPVQEQRSLTPNKKNKLFKTSSTAVTALPTNSKDSSKKERPFPISVRKSRSNPAATDPPAPNSLSVQTGRSPTTASSLHYLKSPDPQDVLADLQRGSNTAASSTAMHHRDAFEEKKMDEQQQQQHPFSTVVPSQSSEKDFEVVYGKDAKLNPAAELSFGPAAATTTMGFGEELELSPKRTPRKPDTGHGQQPAAAVAAGAKSTHKQNSKKPAVGKTKALLSRPFGRASLPPTIGRKWVVEVSSAEWDADEHRWKYRILVQRRQLQAGEVETEQQQQLPQSMTAAFTWRSLADFAWLERAVRHEFHGGLVLPILSIALGRPETANLDGMPVEAEKLRNWFSDVLNGVRGQGELILNHGGVNLIKSESMEAFLYRNNGPLLEGGLPGMSKERLASGTDGAGEESFVQSFFNKSFGFAPLELCTGGGSQTVDTVTELPGSRSTNRSGLANKLPLDMLTCQSRALGSAATLEVQDSFVDNSTVAGGSSMPSNDVVIHSELLESEKELALNYRKTALIALEKLQVLAEEEEKVGVAWKRFAISLSNLFAYEKDAEHAKLGNSKIKRENMPYRKISKSSVDECLRVMARQKNDRAFPSLKALTSMLSAYVADLSAVEPAVDMYNDAIIEMAFLEESPVDNMQIPRQTESWEDKLRSLASTTMSDVKKQAVRSLHGVRADASNRSNDDDEGKSKRRAYQSLLAKNETLLRESLTTLCRATPIRVARMAWKYWNTEAHQCTLLNAASLSLRTKVGIASKDSVSKMIKRHLGQEKEDRVAELDLVQRIVIIGNSKKFSLAADDSAIDNDAKVEIDNDDISEERSKAMRRDKALQVIRSRVGRWDAKLALSIMEAVGVDDPNVRVEETTRELRLIRKYAIGLRENLQRCIEAVQLLQVSMKGEPDKATPGKPVKDLRTLREEFLEAIAKVFSGSLISESSKRESKGSTASIAILSKVGIDTGDPFGWSSAYKSSSKSSKTAFTQGQLGSLAVTYMDARDSQTEWLLSSIAELLNEYVERIEVVESFVYMECVGIQLEKHFSLKRAQALAHFERKTDITTALNIATRKRMPALVTELQSKMDALGPTVSHTLVKEMKDAHLESKTLKAELHELATRRLLRAREASTERAITVMSLWAKEEESAATAELKDLGEAMSALERTVSKETADAHY